MLSRNWRVVINVIVPVKIAQASRVDQDKYGTVIILVEYFLEKRITEA